MQPGHNWWGHLPEERAPPEREEGHTLHLRRAWGHRRGSGQRSQILAELCRASNSGKGYTLKHGKMQVYVQV